MTDNQRTGPIPTGYTLYSVTIDGIIADVVANLSATHSGAAWEEVAKITGAMPTPAIIRSLKKAYRITPVYETLAHD